MVSLVGITFTYKGNEYKVINESKSKCHLYPNHCESCPRKYDNICNSKGWIDGCIYQSVSDKKTYFRHMYDMISIM